MKQVFVINGGNVFSTYEEYFADLQAKTFKPYWLETRDWKTNLSTSLGEGYEVMLPRMPSSNNAKYLEWKIWFDKFIEHVEDGVILVGHSLGGVFLAKYLSEVRYQKKILATFLIAAPYDMGKEGEDSGFKLPDSLKLFGEQSNQIFLYQSKDDPVVLFTELERYQKQLPNAKARIFEDRQHFNQEQLQELVQDIQDLG